MLLSLTLAAWTLTSGVLRHGATLSGTTGEPEPVVYLVAEVTIVRAAPDASAAVVGRLIPPALVVVDRTMQSWLRVMGGSDETTSPLQGWIHFEGQRVVAESFERLQRRLTKLRREKWALEVKLEILRGRVRAGFTPAQVRLALGDPPEKLLQRRGDDIYEVWRYPDRLIAFSHSAVESVEPTRDP